MPSSSENFLKEEDMQNVPESSTAPEKGPVPEGTWIQITFTLDPDDYRALWERAEEEHLTITSLVRQRVMDSFLEGKISSRREASGSHEKLRRIL